MNANDKQVGGSHYKSAEDNGLPQHWDVVTGMGWSYLIGNATKYLWRLDKKGGPDKAIQDLEKAIHYLQKELEIRKEVQRVAEQKAEDNADYKSRFRGGDFPFAEVKCKTVEITTPKPPIMTLGDLLRERIREEGLDADSRYTNQG